MSEQELLTADETKRLLRLDAEPGDADERLRNLIRRHQLPAIKIGKQFRFRRSAVNAWLERHEVGAKTTTLARQIAPQRLTSTTAKKTIPCAKGA